MANDTRVSAPIKKIANSPLGVIFTACKQLPADNYMNRSLERLTEDERNRRQAALAAVQGFDQLIGQGDLVERLKLFGELYVRRAEIPEHVLISGPEGMGKRTFARAFAKNFSKALIEKEAGEFQRVYDMTGLLTSLDQGDAVIMEGMRELRKPVAEVLQVGLEKFRINLIIGVGSASRTHPFELNRFVLIGTSNKIADVPPELSRSFALSLVLQPYTNEELKALVVLLAGKHGLALPDEVAPMVVAATQRTPASIEQLLLRLGRLGKKSLCEDDLQEAFAAFGLARRVGQPGVASDLDSLTGVEFEKVITGLFQKMGFRAEMTRATGDGGIDIVAHLDKPIVGGRYLIQCKRFESPVGAPIVREFYGAVVADRLAVKGILITTSDFTDQARDFASSLPLELINRLRLDALLSEFGT